MARFTGDSGLFNPPLDGVAYRFELEIDNDFGLPVRRGVAIVVLVVGTTEIDCVMEWAGCCFERREFGESAKD